MGQLVNKYNVYNIMHLHMEKWLISAADPTTGAEFLAWINIAWICKDNERLAQLTRDLIFTHVGPFENIFDNVIGDPDAILPVEIGRVHLIRGFFL